MDLTVISFLEQKQIKYTIIKLNFKVKCIFFIIKDVLNEHEENNQKISTFQIKKSSSKKPSVKRSAVKKTVKKVVAKKKTVKSKKPTTKKSSTSIKRKATVKPKSK